MVSKSFFTTRASGTMLNTCRRAWSVSRLARVTIWSARPRTALALASVVMMRSWRKRATRRFLNRAQRCEVTRPSLNPALPCLIRAPAPQGPEQVRVDPHAEGKSQRGEGGLDLIDGLVAEILDLLEIRIGLLHEVRHHEELGILEGIDGAGGQGQIVEWLGETILERALARALRLFLFFLSALGSEEGELVAHMGGRLRQGLVRRYRAVRPHLHDQTVIVGDLAEPRVLHVVGDALDGREGRVEGNGPVGHAARRMPVGRGVSAAHADAEIDDEGGARLQRGDVQLGVEHLHSRGLRDVGARDRLGPRGLEARLHGFPRRHVDRELLEVEKHVLRALGDPGQRRLHVPHPFDACPRHGRPRNDGEQGAAQRVAHGEGIALLERLGEKTAVPVRKDLPLDRLRLLKWNPCHTVPSFARGQLYLENSSTIICSCTGIWMSSRMGSPRTVPFFSLTSTSSQAGIWPRPAPRLSATRSCILDVDRSCTTSPTFTIYEGMETFRLLTWMWP